MIGDTHPGRSMNRDKGFGILRVVLAALLLGAAMLKAHQLATEPVAEHDILSFRWSLMMQVEFEIFFGFLLLSGLFKRLTWGLAAGCFTVFCGVTLHKALAGEASCGCFGTIDVNPWYTLALDSACLLALLVFRPSLKAGPAISMQRQRALAVLLLTVGAGLPAAIAMASYQPATLSADGEIIGDDHFVVLQPESWLGKRLPLFKHIDTKADLSKGSWTVVLYHHDCPNCRKEVPQLAAKHSNDKSLLAMIEMPPYAEDGKGILADDGKCSRGRLSSAREWFVATPTILQLHDGVVTSVKEGPSQTKEAAAMARLQYKQATADGDVPQVRDRHDFGFVSPSTHHAVEFAVENPSDKPIGITKAISDCTCLSVVDPPTLIEPNSKALIRVLFAAPAENLRYSKKVVLFTSDKSRPVIPLRIEANVGMPLELAPRTQEAGTLAVGEERTVRIKLRNRGKNPTSLLYATANGSGCSVAIPRAPLQPESEAVIIATIKGVGAAGTKVNGRFTIHTDCPTQQTVAGDIRYSLDQNYGISLGRIDAGRLHPSERRRFQTVIRHSQPDGIVEVTGCQITGVSNVTAYATVTPDKQQVTISIDITAGGPPGTISGAIHISLAGRREPVVIPIMGEVAPR